MPFVLVKQQKKPRKRNMAAMLSLVKLPPQLLPLNSNNNNITPKNTINLPLSKNSSSHQTPLLTPSIIHHLKSVSLPLSAITLPFFLDSKARTYYKHPIHNSSFLITLFFNWCTCTCNNLTTSDVTGCIGCWWGVWIAGRKIICFDSPRCDGSFICLYIIYWLFGLAMASSSNYSEWD